MYSRCKILANFRFLSFNVSQCKNSTDVGGNKIKYGKKFFKKEVQNILQNITVKDREIIFKTRHANRSLKTPIVEFMTAQQLENEENLVRKKMSKLLQMPPVIDPVEDKLEILDSNEALDGHDLEHSKILFTDISEGYCNEERLIVVREPNGVLRKAYRNERHRMNEIYFPINGRKYEMPKMFEEEQLKNLINKKNFIFILDHACVQFDPDDPMYHKVIEPTYEAINNCLDYEKLESTRHFGSLAFYLTIHKKIDSFLIYLIQHKRLNDAVSLIQLYYIIHPDCKSAEKVKKSDANILKIYVEEEAFNKENLQKALNRYFLELEKTEGAENLKEAQGV